jgi:hypothetical protein
MGGPKRRRPPFDPSVRNPQTPKKESAGMSNGEYEQYDEKNYLPSRSG